MKGKCVECRWICIFPLQRKSNRNTYSACPLYSFFYPFALDPIHHCICKLGLVLVQRPVCTWTCTCWSTQCGISWLAGHMWRWSCHNPQGWYWYDHADSRTSLRQNAGEAYIRLNRLSTSLLVRSWGEGQGPWWTRLAFGSDFMDVRFCNSQTCRHIYCRECYEWKRKKNCAVTASVSRFLLIFY